jgi:chromosome segregation ATPase
MPDTNGSEWEARWQRNEEEHDQFRRDLRDLLTAQVIQQGRIDDLLKATERLSSSMEQSRAKEAVLDKRVDDLVSAIADLIRRIPPENLR